MKKEHAMKNIKKRERKNFSLVYTIALVFLMTAAIIPGVMGDSPVDLGSACNFAILAKTGITNVPISSINGNMGVSPIKAAAITGFALTMDPSSQFSTSSQVTGKVYASDYSPDTPSMMTGAISAMEAAYTDGAGRSPTDVTFMDKGAGNIGGMNLLPGVYTWSTGVTIPTSVTLSGGPDDVWIFVIPGTLDISSGQQVILSGDAQPNNIFWVVAGTTTLGTDSLFNGNILDQTLIDIQTRAILNGKALAQSAVTLDQVTVNGPATCAIPVPESIVLTPITATNTLGQTHTVTATVKDSNGNAVVGKSVTFAVTVGPNAGTTGNGVTDSTGQVTFSYVGNVVGTDTIIASFVDNTGATIQSSEVTKKWEQVTPLTESIVLTPITATNTIGQTHTMTATVKDSNGNALVGKSVTFVITVGPNAGTTVNGVTDSTGQVTFSYVGTVVGTDTIIASFLDNAGITIQSNEVTKKWEQGTPVPEFPTVAVPVVMLIGIVFIFHSIRRKE
jgi:hypothetical protein